MSTLTLIFVITLLEYINLEKDWSNSISHTVLLYEVFPNSIYQNKIVIRIITYLQMIFVLFFGLPVILLA